MTNSENLVLVDTCIWASFFQKPDSYEKKVVDRLIDEDRVALIGPLLTEILIGFRRKEQSDWVASRLRLFHRPKIEWEDWKSAAVMGSRLIALGHKLPLTDLALGAVAKQIGASIYSSDPHFDLISGIDRFSP